MLVAVAALGGVGARPERRQLRARVPYGKKVTICHKGKKRSASARSAVAGAPAPRRHARPVRERRGEEGQGREAQGREAQGSQGQGSQGRGGEGQGSRQRPKAERAEKKEGKSERGDNPGKGKKGRERARASRPQGHTQPFGRFEGPVSRPLECCGRGACTACRRTAPDDRSGSPSRASRAPQRRRCGRARSPPCESGCPRSSGSSPPSSSGDLSVFVDDLDFVVPRAFPELHFHLDRVAFVVEAGGDGVWTKLSSAPQPAGVAAAPPERRVARVVVGV